MQVPKGYIIIKEEDYLAMQQLIVQLQNQVKLLQQRIEDLESQLKNNSSNSHKPPSSDGYKKKIKNNRIKSDKKQGAQKGHKGVTLTMTDTLDHIVERKVQGQCSCGRFWSDQPTINKQRRQVIDLPKKFIETTEYRIEIKQCGCGEIHYGETGRLILVQYGNRVKVLAVYMNKYEHIPYERLQDIFRNCFGISISDGILVNSN